MDRLKLAKLIRDVFRRAAEETGEYFHEYDDSVEVQPNFVFDGEVPVAELVDAIIMQTKRES